MLGTTVTIWTITNGHGVALAWFTTAEEAWAVLTCAAALALLGDRYEEQTGEYVDEFRIACNGIEVVFH
jgi:hypothetical protein